MAADLNASQREAVGILSGPLLVLAGAGTGKTRVVTYRIAELIRRGVPPERILAVTFTNKAAGEMQSRAATLLGNRQIKKPEISTFHSLCVRVLRRQISLLGYPSQFAIYDRGDQESLARAALREIKVDAAVLRPGDLIHMIGRWKTSSIDPTQAATIARDDKEHLGALAYRRYQKALVTAGAVDFDDLLLRVEEIFAKFPTARAIEAARFSHLLVDEYQDTNGAQYRIVKALAEPHRNLCVVGDDDQSIYGWRGAEVAHILRFQKDWPDAKIVRLEENYRSTAEILGMANRLIAHNKNRHGKILRAFRESGEEPRVLQFPDETAEAKEIAKEIHDQVERQFAQPRDFAILCRTKEQPRPFEQEFRRLKLPYSLIGGMSFYDRKEVKDILAYLRLLTAPRDEVALRRIINCPPRGVGDSAIERLLAQATRAGKPLWDILPDAIRERELAAATVRGLQRLMATLEESRARLKTEKLVKVATDLIAQLDYRQEIERIYPHPEERQARWSSVEEVVNSLGAYERETESPSLVNFLDEIAVAGRDDQDDKESKLAKNAILLMTLHAAKGLEFPQVYLVGMEEGLLPHHRSVADGGAAIDEERRLCYVGVTRARERLTLTMAAGRMKWGKVRDTIPSRFVFELLGKADNAQAIAAKRKAEEAIRPRVPNRPSRP